MRHPRLILFLVLLTVFLTGELAAHKYLDQFGDKRPFRFPESDQSAAFHADSSEDNWRLTDDFLWIPDDRSGPFHNFRDGFRVTTGQPKHAEHTLWMVGNSSLVGNAVADDQTIPSDLQRLVGDQLRVVNVGMSRGADTLMQALRLRKLPIQPGDTVVLFDGAVETYEVFNLIYRRYSEYPGCQILRPLSSLNLVQMFCPSGETVFPFDPAWVDEFSSQVAHQYWRNTLDAFVYARSQGAVVYHFIQPNRLATPITGDDKYLYQVNYLQVGGALLRAIQQDAPHDKWFVDLAALPFPTRVFMDFDHLNATGNQVVARVIYDYLVQTF